MNRTASAGLCFLLCLPAINQAEVIKQGANSTEVVIPANAPTRGMSKQTVIKKWGAPATKHKAVGQPPISSWDYAGFSVYFEHHRVLHSVATNK